MTSNRVKVPPNVAALIEFQADRTCCVCRDPTKDCQLHHLDGNPANSDPDNLVLLCLQHHHEAELSGGLARKLNAGQIRLYRDEWYAVVEARKPWGPAPASAETTPVPDPSAGLRRLIREGIDLVSETHMAGAAAESRLDGRSAEEKRAELADYRERTDTWTTAVEAELAGTPAAVAFMETSFIPATGLYAIHNQVKARVEFLRRAVESPLASSRTPVEQLTAAISQGMRLRTRVLQRPDESLPFENDPLFHWARRAYDLLRTHFVLAADDFYGEDPELGSPHFALAFVFATKDLGRGGYLESRLTMLKAALQGAG